MTYNERRYHISVPSLGTKMHPERCSQLGAILRPTRSPRPAQGHLVMSGDTFGCHNCGGTASSAHGI